MSGPEGLIPGMGAAREEGQQSSSPGAGAGPGAVSTQWPHLLQTPLVTNRSCVCRSHSPSASALRTSVYNKHPR